MILVTGGAGFIGQHLVRRLAAEGEEVAVIDSFEGQVHHGVRHARIDGAARMVVGRLDQDHLLQHALDGVDRVVHLAAVVGVGQSQYEAGRYVRRNTYETAVLMEALRGRDIEKLIVASSMSIYGEGEYRCDHGWGQIGHHPLPRTPEKMAAGQWGIVCACGATMSPVATSENKPLVPASVYAITKRDQEELCLVLGDTYGIPTTALRFFNVYGPGQALGNPYTGAAAIFATRILNGCPPIIFEDGMQSRDLIHVSDIVSGIVAALKAGPEASGQAINLGTGKARTIGQTAHVIGQALGWNAPVINGTGEFRSGDIRHCFADISKARKLLRWAPTVQWANGIAEYARSVADERPADHTARAMTSLYENGLIR